MTETVKIPELDITKPLWFVSEDTLVNEVVSCLPVYNKDKWATQYIVVYEDFRGNQQSHVVSSRSGRSLDFKSHGALVNKGNVLAYEVTVEYNSGMEAFYMSNVDLSAIAKFISGSILFDLDTMQNRIDDTITFTRVKI